MQASTTAHTYTPASTALVHEPDKHASLDADDLWCSSVTEADSEFAVGTWQWPPRES